VTVDAALFELARATASVERKQRQALADEFGTRDCFIQGMAYHNLDHSAEVAEAAEAAAELLAIEGRLPAWAPLAARLCGLFHDCVQNEGAGRNEDRSAEVAATTLERDGAFSQEFIELVVSGISATKVLDRNEDRLVQNARADDPMRALMADSDLGSLGSPGAARRALGLFVELRREELELPHRAGLRSAHPDADDGTEFLLSQARLHRRHEYLLAHSARRFMYQEANARTLESLARAWSDGSATWSDLLALVGVN
jgi:predicted metal-dependent HD superfamily phosphohydrolase